MLAEIWDALGPWVVSAAGGAIGAATLLPTKLGESLFKYRFDKAIEGYKAEQGTKLERLREQLSHIGDRGKRSNEMEFTAIREVWEKTVEAYLATANCTTNYMEFPDLNRLPDEELDGFLSTTGFSKEQNDQIRTAADHNDMYAKIVTWRSIGEAGQKNFDVQLLLRKQRIFMPGAIHAEFQSIVDMLRGAQVERKLQFQHPHIPRNEWGGAVSRFFEQGDTTLDRLADVANQRLFRNEA
ncbi:hypothetical protein ACVIW2_008103 [Bradyrhizobium huanghuaihaiense]